MRKYKRYPSKHFDFQSFVDLNEFAFPRKMKNNGLLSSLVLFLIVCCYHVDSKNSEYCAKIDFNRTSFTDFRQCTAQYLPQFVVKSYTNTPIIKPYRARALYYLSTDFVGYSCVESTRTFFMNSNTRIVAAVLLKAADYVNIEISVYNTELNRKIYSWINGTSSGQSSSWFIMSGQVMETIPRAEVTSYTVLRFLIRIAAFSIVFICYR